jgi:hypothetical protein
VHASGGASADYTTEEDGNNERIRIGDPDRTISGAHIYEITYRVKGVLNGFRDHDELVFNAVGTEWDVPIDSAAAVVHAPGTITAVNCATGFYGSNLGCTSAAADGDTARFTTDGLLPMEGMTVTAAMPKGVVPAPRPILEERFSFGSAFRVTSATGAIAGGLLALVLAGVGIVAWRWRDRRYEGSPVDAAFGSADAREETTPLLEHDETPVEFVPPDGLHPGQVGTLADFTANPLDVTATIVDLAVRGCLVIEEVHDAGPVDWKLTKKKEEEGSDLLSYERKLLDGLFEGGSPVQLSELRNHFAPRMAKVRDELMDDAVAKGWFVGRPGHARVIAGSLAAVVLAAGIGLTVGLAVTTHAALVGVPFVIGGLLLLLGVRLAPRRTAKGYAVLRHVDGFRRFIEESEKGRAEFAEKKNLFSEYLPYAVVFGATKKWARAFAGLDGQPPDTSSWYVGPFVFNYLVFSSAIDSFTVSTAGTLTSTPPSTSGSSGFGGGGFSGGGFGGGGGGSW